ncbi:hypothetical protein [Mycobacterium avium]|nr:hypothetical protein [Mycobacterium avium]
MLSYTTFFGALAEALFGALVCGAGLLLGGRDLGRRVGAYPL